METDPTRIAEALVGLGADVSIVGVDDEASEPLRVHIELDRQRPRCRGCESHVVLGDRRRVELVDLGVSGGQRD